MEYPKTLYRAGEEIIWEGRNIATLIVADVKAEEAAIAKGWQRVEDFLSSKIEAVKKAARRK